MLTSSPCIGGDALHGVYFHPAVRHHQRQEEEEDSAAEGEKKQKTQLQRTGKVRNKIPFFAFFVREDSEYEIDNRTSSTEQLILGLLFPLESNNSTRLLSAFKLRALQWDVPKAMPALNAAVWQCYGFYHRKSFNNLFIITQNVNSLRAIRSFQAFFQPGK